MAFRKLLNRGQLIPRPVRRIAQRVLFFLSIMGPGLITASADNDAAGVATYSMVGSYYGYGMLWVILWITVGEVLVQEMAARMGAVTGKGLTDLIRERFGVKPALLVIGGLVLANLGTTAAQFAGIAASAQLFGLPHYLVVPLAAVLVWWLVVHGSYERVEKVLLVLSLRDNPQAGKLRAERELEGAIATQVAALEDAIQTIERNPDLSPAEREALTRPLEEARDILKQPGVSQEEAVAALAEASQSLSEMSGGMTPQDEAPYQQAARPLSGSEQTADVADALAKPDLGEAADALDDLADDLAAGSLDEQEQQDLAGRLEQVADAVEEQNPALAQIRREAAAELHSGDLEEAQESLREAGELLRDQQQQSEQSPLAGAARAAQELSLIHISEPTRPY